LQREVKSSAALDKMQVTEMAAASTPERRRIGNRTFQLRDGALQDLHVNSAARNVRIQPYSGAYFRVLQALPELASYWHAGDNVVVGGRRVTIRLAADGVRELSQDDIQRLVVEFRAS
jgi:hypothetical protein